MMKNYLITDYTLGYFSMSDLSGGTIYNSSGKYLVENQSTGDTLKVVDNIIEIGETNFNILTDDNGNIKTKPNEIYLIKGDKGITKNVPCSVLNNNYLYTDYWTGVTLPTISLFIYWNGGSCSTRTQYLSLVGSTGYLIEMGLTTSAGPYWTNRVWAGSTAYATSNTDFVVQYGKWYHIVFTFDGVYLYNYVSDLSGNHTSKNIVLGTGPSDIYPHNFRIFDSPKGAYITDAIISEVIVENRYWTLSMADNYLKNLGVL